MQKQLVKVGTLVMWNLEVSEHFGAMGIVIWVAPNDTDNFLVRWSQSDEVCSYGSGDISKCHLKVVKK